jgi:hypothetical protein
MRVGRFVGVCGSAWVSKETFRAVGSESAGN